MGSKERKRGNSWAIPHQLVLVWKPAGLRLWAPALGNLAGLCSPHPPAALVIAQLQAACWGTHARAQGQDHVPHHPWRGRVNWKLSLESSWQRQSPWDSPLPSVNAHWQHNYKRAGVPPSQGREQEKHTAKLMSPERDFLKVHIGSTSAGGVDFRLCSKKASLQENQTSSLGSSKSLFFI